MERKITNPPLYNRFVAYVLKNVKMYWEPQFYRDYDNTSTWYWYITCDVNSEDVTRIYDSVSAKIENGYVSLLEAVEAVANMRDYMIGLGPLGVEAVYKKGVVNLPNQYSIPGGWGATTWEHGPVHICSGYQIAR